MAALTPSQTVGPFFHYALTDDHAVSELTSPQTRGQHITLRGRVFDSEGCAVPDATIEIWQADADGRYDHPDDRRDMPRDPAFHGFGRCATDGRGGYAFRTIRPGPVAGPSNTLQAPHILVSLFARGLLKQLVTRIYFASEPLNDSDPVLGLVAEEGRRQTLIATAREDGSYVFDIHLGGASETVFFET
jgi:protocatechuate 3,4-dioxygenase, alpha subunit